MKTVKIFSVLAIALAATAARAEDSYLYWMVSGANYNNSAIEFAYATIKAEGGDSYLNLYAPGATDSSISALASTAYPNGMSSSTDGGAFAKFDYSSATTFLVELWNANNTVVGWQSYSYDDWQNFVYTSTGAGSASPLTVSAVVPEPTSGLLMLFGLAGLALRRKRRA